jgi:hypothetical protein
MNITLYIIAVSICVIVIGGLVFFARSEARNTQVEEEEGKIKVKEADVAEEEIMVEGENEEKGNRPSNILGNIIGIVIAIGGWFLSQMIYTWLKMYVFD